MELICQSAIRKTGRKEKQRFNSWDVISASEIGKDKNGKEEGEEETKKKKKKTKES